MPVLALTPNEKAYHQMAFLWGVMPIKADKLDNVQKAITQTADYAKKARIAKKGDLVVMTTGTPFFIKGTTNTMIVESI